MNDETDWSGEPTTDERRLATIIWLFLLPPATFLYGIEILARTMREMQSRVSEAVAKTSSAPSPLPADYYQDASGTPLLSSTTDSSTPKEEEVVTNNNGYSTCIDKDLSDDMLKLVRYKILFIKRDFEYAFPEQEELVFDNISGEDFTAWKIAEFIQRIGRCEDRCETERLRVPEKWKRKGYPSYEHHHCVPEEHDRAELERLEREVKESRERATKQNATDKDREAVAKAERAFEDKRRCTPYYLCGFPEEDKKFLRLFYQVLDRYEREKFKHDERQIEVLEDIKKVLERRA
jgi:hypothetical protein